MKVTEYSVGILRIYLGKNSLAKCEIPTQKNGSILPMVKVFPKYYRRNSTPICVLDVSTGSCILCFFYPAMIRNSSPPLKTAGALYCCSIQQYREFTQVHLSQEEYWKTLSIGYFRAFLSSVFVIYKMSSSLVCYSGNLLRGNEQEIWHCFQHHSP